MRVTLDAHGATDPGKTRTRNEDYFVVDSDAGVYVVCDGMGGHAAGDEASRLAAETFHAEIAAHRAPLDRLATDPSEEARIAAQQLVVDSIERACGVVWAAQEADPQKRGMGSTMVCLVRAGARMVLGHVGDSHVYLLRAGKVYRLTEDHTLAEAQVKQGFVTREAAEHSDFKNVLLRAVGAQPNVQVDTLLMDLVAGDLILLCSDGLHGYLEDDELPALLESAPARELPAHLIALANERGGSDNITALVIEASGEVTETLPVSARIEAVRGLPLFRHLSYKEAVSLLAIAQARTIAAGTVIVREGSQDREMYVVSSGRVAVERGGSLIAELGPGGVFGEMSLVDDMPRSATVKALDPTELVVLTQKDMRGLMQRDPVVGLKIVFCLAQELSVRLRHTNAELELLIGQDVERVPSTEPVPFTRGENRR